MWCLDGDVKIEFVLIGSADWCCKLINYLDNRLQLVLRRRYLLQQLVQFVVRLGFALNQLMGWCHHHRRHHHRPLLRYHRRIARDSHRRHHRLLNKSQIKIFFSSFRISRKNIPSCYQLELKTCFQSVLYDSRRKTSCFFWQKNSLSRIVCFFFGKQEKLLSFSGF